MTLFFFVNTFCYLYILNDLIKYRIPNEYEYMCIWIIYNALYIYSICEIKYKKYKNIITSFQKSEIIPIEENTLEFIKNNAVVYKTTKDSFLENNFTIPEFDFVIYSIYSTNKIFYSLPTKEDMNEMVLSNAIILLSELIIKDKVIKINFKCDSYNFFIVDNVFKNIFLCYFFNKYYPDDYREDDYINFKINILDENVDMILINSNNILHIGRDKITLT